MKLMPHSNRNESVASDHSGSVQKIMDGTLRAINSIGARRLSMSDISKGSGVSRGTLYRYFASKEEVLAAFSEYICSNFEKGIVESGEGIADPIEQFRAVMRFYGRFTIERSPERNFRGRTGLPSQFPAQPFQSPQGCGPACARSCTRLFRQAHRKPDRPGRVLRHVGPPATEHAHHSRHAAVAGDLDSTPDRVCEWALQIAAHQN